MRTLQLHPLQRYALAVAALLLATLVRWLLDPVLGEHATFPTFFVAVVVVALYVGLGPALLTLMLSGLVASALFFPPTGYLVIATQDQWARLALFYAAAAVTLALAARLRASRRNLVETEREAEATGALLKHITDSVPMLFAHVDRELRYRYVSAGYEAWFQMSPASIRGRHVREVVGESVFAQLEPLLHRALEGEVVEYEQELDFREAGPRRVRVRYDPIHRGGHSDGFSVVLVDVTERRRLDERAAQLAAIVTAAQEAIIKRTLDGIVTDWNAGAERVYGYSAEEMVGRSIERLALPERADEDTWLAAEAAAGRAVDQFETIRRRKDGSPIHILLSAAPIRDAEGRATALASIERDITERKQAEAALRASEAQLQAILDNSPLVLFIKDLEGRYLLANPSYLALFGIAAEDLIGRTDYERSLPSEFAAAMRANDLEVIKSGQPQKFEESTEIGGVLRTYVSTKFPLRDHEGRIYAVCGISTDITEQKQQEEKLRETDRRKDQFLSMLAHELRNPLTPIVNAVQVLRVHGVDSADERVQWAAGVIDRQARHLTRLVDDLLDIARINSGRIRLRRRLVDLGELAKQTAASARPRFEAREVRLDVEVPTEPLMVEADDNRIVQVMDNLLDNAAKYTDRGGSVRLRVQSEGEQAVVRVSDSGIGIDPAYLPQVFELFEQADASLDRSRGGLGLGLNLVKRLVEKHRGSVEAHSAGLGRGSEFLFRLPLAPAGIVAARRERPAAERLPRQRVLVIEDNADVAQSLEQLLVALGQTVRVAENGRQGVEAAAAFQPHLILTDLGLPDISGYEVARVLRERYGQAIRLVAVSGYGQDEYRARSTEAGFDEHLVKPPSVEALRRTLTACARGRTGAPADALAAPLESRPR